MRFYILDCKDNIIGNPKGYQTMRGVHQAMHKRSKTLALAYERLADARKVDPKETTIWRTIER